MGIKFHNKIRISTINISVNKVISLLKYGLVKEAYLELVKTNPFPEILERICDGYCEASCINAKDGKATEIKNILRTLADYGLDNFIDLECAPNNGKKVSIIASGLSGLIVAYSLRKKGYDVTVYVHNSKKITIKSEKLTIIEGQINDLETMKKALSGQDAVIWCVGIPMSRSYEKMESLEGHKVLIEAMKFNKVKRLVDWATPSVKSSEDKNSFITIFPGIAAGIMFNQAKKEIIAL